MNTLLKSICVLSSVLAILPGMAGAQISVTSGDILGLIGDSQIIESDTTASVTVNVGSAGANQTWDFTAVTVDGFRTTQSFSASAGTPFEADFPTANFVLSFSDSSGDAGFADAVVYEYSQVTSSSFSNVGGGIVVPSLDTALVGFRSEDVAPLPLGFNTSWVSTETDTFGDPATFASVCLDTSTHLVDAWGTLQLPIGTFDCLRVRTDSKYLEKTFVNGMVTSMSTSTTIDYAWLTKDNFVLVEAESQDDDTNPNFTNAASFQWVASLATGVEDENEGGQAPDNFILSQNYPNPFNPETLINYQTPEDGQVELAVYNLLGQKIRSLVNERLRAGSHQIKWDGSDDFGMRVASGLYLYRLKAGQLVNSRRMLLLK